ncbi:MAG TPA: hypothetical protein VFB79_16610 [Candidatus Angelobacter sp.]|nr:hypothetical protein [Candidatus Angelobacter sp.]
MQALFLWTTSAQAVLILWIYSRDFNIFPVFEGLSSNKVHFIMNIEVLTALKKAKFPLKRLSDLLEQVGLPGTEEEYARLFPNAVKIAGKWFLEPTLDDFIRTLEAHCFYLWKLNDRWIAAVGDDDSSAETPLEALANLFIEVNR